MVRLPGLLRTEPGTTCAPTLRPTSWNVESASVRATSSVGVRKYTPVCFTPETMSPATPAMITSEPARNLVPAVIRPPGEKYISASDSPLPTSPEQHTVHGSPPTVEEAMALLGAHPGLEYLVPVGRDEVFEGRPDPKTQSRQG